MNPYIVLAVSITLGLGGFKLGVDHEQASQAREERHMREAREAAREGAAEAIAGIKPKFTTIQGKLEKEIETHTIYRDCKLSPDGMLLINRALAGGSVTAEGKLPKEIAPSDQ